MDQDLESIIKLENEKRILRAKEYVRKKLKGDRILWPWPIKGPEDSYKRTKKIHVATSSSGDRVFMDPKTGESLVVRAQQSIDPVKVEKQVTQPPPPAPDVQHKIQTQEILKPKQSDPGNMSHQAHRKASKRKARAVKDVTIDKISINPVTIEGQTRKLARKLRIQRRRKIRTPSKKDRPVDYKTPYQRKKEAVSERRTFGSSVSPAIKAAKKARAARQAREDYIKKPKRKFSEDFKTFFEDVKNTGKRFSKEFIVPKTKRLLQKKWFRGGLWGVGSTIAFNLVRDQVARALEPPRAIPEEYERGYDNIKQTLTDFGSPINLAKAAQKVIVPYYSTVRSGLRTNVNTIINHNYALASSKNAIRHMQY